MVKNAYIDLPFLNAFSVENLAKRKKAIVIVVYLIFFMGSPVQVNHSYNFFSISKLKIVFSALLTKSQVLYFFICNVSLISLGNNNVKFSFSEKGTKI